MQDCSQINRFEDAFNQMVGPPPKGGAAGRAPQLATTYAQYREGNDTHLDSIPIMSGTSNKTTLPSEIPSSRHQTEYPPNYGVEINMNTKSASSSWCNHSSMMSSISSPSALQTLKRELKQELFFNQHGSMSVNVEKEPTGNLHENYKSSLKNRIVTLESVDVSSSTDNTPQLCGSGSISAQKVDDLSSKGSSSRPRDSSDSLTALKDEKQALYETLRAYESQFHRLQGRQVSSYNDIRPVSPQYRRYGEIMKMISALQSKVSSKKAGDVSSKGPIFRPRDSSDSLTALKDEKKALYETIEAYEKQFHRLQGRQVSSYNDIRPVAPQYRRYWEIMKMIPALQSKVSSQKADDFSSKETMSNGTFQTQKAMDASITQSRNYLEGLRAKLVEKKMRIHEFKQKYRVETQKAMDASDLLQDAQAKRIPESQTTTTNTNTRWRRFRQDVLVVFPITEIEIRPSSSSSSSVSSLPFHGGGDYYRGSLLQHDQLKETIPITEIEIRPSSSSSSSVSSLPFDGGGDYYRGSLLQHDQLKETNEAVNNSNNNNDACQYKNNNNSNITSKSAIKDIEWDEVITESVLQEINVMGNASEKILAGDEIKKSVVQTNSTNDTHHLDNKLITMKSRDKPESSLTSNTLSRQNKSNSSSTSPTATNSTRSNNTPQQIQTKYDHILSLMLNDDSKPPPIMLNDNSKPPPIKEIYIPVNHQCGDGWYTKWFRRRRRLEK